MARDYSGELVCLHCLEGELKKKLSDDYLDQVDNKLMEDNVYKNINREMFYENPKNLYVPQIGDNVYFSFQGYEEVVGFYPYHFITLEEERDGPIKDYFNVFLEENNLAQKNILTHNVLKCHIKNLQYFLPSATTYEMNQKLETGNDEFSIQSVLELSVLEPENLKDKTFKILFFNTNSLSANISINYIVPEAEFEQAIPVEECPDLINRVLKPVSVHESPKEVLEISDYEPEVYPNSIYKNICYRQQVYNINPDGHQLRTNVSGRSQIYQTGRVSTWEVKKNQELTYSQKEYEDKLYEENKQFHIENQT